MTVPGKLPPTPAPGGSGAGAGVGTSGENSADISAHFSAESRSCAGAPVSPDPGTSPGPHLDPGLINGRGKWGGKWGGKWAGGGPALLAVGVVLWLAGLGLPLFVSGAWVTVGGVFAIYSIVALSQDIVLGRAGIYDMGHAVYFGVGAYATGILSLTWGWPVLWTIPVGVCAAALLGAILSAPIIKLRGDYLLVATIGLNAIFVLAMQNNLAGLTGGHDGLFGVGGPVVLGYRLGSQKALFYLNWAALALVVWLVHNLGSSAFGRTLGLIKSDALAAATLGVDIRAFRVGAFALAAGVAGFAGTLFAMEFSAVSPDSFRFTESVTLFAIVIVGGQASIAGVLLGTALMFVVPQVFTDLAQYRYFVFGIAMILIMIIRPQGIWPSRSRARP